MEQILKDKLKEITQQIEGLEKEKEKLMSELEQLRNNHVLQGFDEVMFKYYSHKLPNKFGEDTTYLYNYWNNKKDEGKMQELFACDLDRYDTYDVAVLLWEYECAVDWLKERDVSDKTIEGLSQWYSYCPDSKYFDKKEFYKNAIKSINDIPTDELEAVQEYMRLFYNIIVNEFKYDW